MFCRCRETRNLFRPSCYFLNLKFTRLNKKVTRRYVTDTLAGELKTGRFEKSKIWEKSSNFLRILLNNYNRRASVNNSRRDRFSSRSQSQRIDFSLFKEQRARTTFSGANVFFLSARPGKKTNERPRGRF